MNKELAERVVRLHNARHNLVLCSCFSNCNDCLLKGKCREHIQITVDELTECFNKMNDVKKRMAHESVEHSATEWEKKVGWKI